MQYQIAIQKDSAWMQASYSIHGKLNSLFVHFEVTVECLLGLFYYKVEYHKLLRIYISHLNTEDSITNGMFAA